MIHVPSPNGLSIDQMAESQYVVHVICPPHRIAQVSPMSDTPARHLNLAGASNFRDLGGYPARDGRTVRWRQIFRSNHLGHLTAADIEVVPGLGGTSPVVFRGSIEPPE